MKVTFLILSLIILQSCGESKTTYLYDDEDPRIQALGEKQCLDKPVFKALDEISSFDNFKKGETYLIKEQENERIPVKKFIQVLSVTPSQITFLMRSPISSENRVINFSAADNKKLLETAARGACQVSKFKYQSSSLESTKRLDISITRKLKYNEYDSLEVKRSYSLRDNLPSLMLLFNSEMNSVKVEGEQEEKILIKKSVTVIKETDRVCKDNNLCDFSSPSSYKTYRSVVNSNDYKSEDIDSVILDFEEI